MRAHLGQSTLVACQYSLHQDDKNQLTEQVRKIRCSYAQVSLREVSKLLRQICTLSTDDFEVRCKGDIEASRTDHSIDLVLIARLVDDTIVSKLNHRLSNHFNILFR